MNLWRRLFGKRPIPPPPPLITSYDILNEIDRIGILFIEGKLSMDETKKILEELYYRLYSLREKR